MSCRVRACSDWSSSVSVINPLAGENHHDFVTKATFTENQLKKYLREQEVELIGGGTDESPFAYKDIRDVMKHQKDLVEVLGVFHPKIVRME
ncbi:MAG: hypothetical protein R3182_13840 [Draconibacterium sp.]|nr:hypothetical protein [Draconibacterium sp.]